MKNVPTLCGISCQNRLTGKLLMPVLYNESDKA